MPDAANSGHAKDYWTTRLERASGKVLNTRARNTIPFGTPFDLRFGIGRVPYKTKDVVASDSNA